MKKTMLILLFCGSMIVGLTGCDNAKGEKQNADIHAFVGIISECEHKSMIVIPNENENEFKSSDKFRIEYVSGFTSCNVGDKVRITYEGMINESYPAQIGTTSIEIIK